MTGRIAFSMNDDASMDIDNDSNDSMDIDAMGDDLAPKSELAAHIAFIIRNGDNDPKALLTATQLLKTSLSDSSIEAQDKAIWHNWVAIKTNRMITANTKLAEHEKFNLTELIPAIQALTSSIQEINTTPQSPRDISDPSVFRPTHEPSILNTAPNNTQNNAQLPDATAFLLRKANAITAIANNNNNNNQ